MNTLGVSCRPLEARLRAYCALPSRAWRARMKALQSRLPSLSPNSSNTMSTCNKQKKELQSLQQVVEALDPMLWSSILLF